MTFEIGHLTIQPAPPVAPASPLRAYAPHPVGALASTPPHPDVDTSSLIPATPPPEVRAEVEAAARRAAELAGENRELHFARDSSTGRMIIQVRTLDGEVLRTIPPSEALNVVAGGTL